MGRMITMDLQMAEYLSKLGMLNFNPRELEQVAADMTGILEIMDTIREIDISYDPLADNKNVFLRDLRQDETRPSMAAEDILRNAVHSEGCFVVPKVVE